MKKLIVIGLALAALAGCVRNTPSEKPPFALDRGMSEQAKYKAQAQSQFFPDGATMRTPVAGTVPRGFLREDLAYFTGSVVDTFPIDKNPVPVTLQLLKRGQERFNIYCSPCHGRDGDAKGIIVSRGLMPPPSFHEERVRLFKDGHIFQVITNGIRNMPPYKYQIPPDDRWAIVAYLRALQRSQNATLNDVPADVRGTLK